MDDLNYFLRRQQQEQALATSATCSQAQAAHSQRARKSEQRINQLASGTAELGRGRSAFASVREVQPALSHIRGLFIRSCIVEHPELARRTTSFAAMHGAADWLALGNDCS